MDSKELYCFDIEIHTVRILRLAFPQYRAASGVDQPAHQSDPAIDQIYVCP